MLKLDLLSLYTCSFFSIALVGLVANAALAEGTYTEQPGTEGNGNFVIGPDYAIDPDLTDRGNPEGKQFDFSMPLADSKIFRGDDPTLDYRFVFSRGTRHCDGKVFEQTLADTLVWMWRGYHGE